MAVIVLCSAGGAPGVTTTATGLGMNWPRDVLIGDCDEHPTQAVLSGWFGGIDPGGRGLSGLARAHREGRAIDTEILPNSFELAPGPPRRLFLPGFNRPGAAAVFGPVWPALVHGLQGASRTGMDVLIDAGRLGPRGLPDPLVQGADMVLLVTGTGLRPLAAVGLYLPLLRTQLQDSPAYLGLLLVGEGRPYGAGEIGGQFGVEVTGAITFDPGGARVYSDGDTPPRKFADSAYAKSLQAVASRLTSLADRQLRAVGVA